MTGLKRGERRRGYGRGERGEGKRGKRTDGVIVRVRRVEGALCLPPPIHTKGFPHRKS